MAVVTSAGMAWAAGSAIRLWWVRFSGSSPGPRTARWLALASQFLIMGLGITMFLVAQVVGHVTWGANGIDLLVVGVWLGWAGFALARTPRALPLTERLLPLGVVLFPWGLLTTVGLFTPGALVLTNPSGGNLELSAAASLLMWLIVVRWALDGEQPTDADADVDATTDTDGVFELRTRTRPAATTLALAVLSMALWPVAALLAWRPQLWSGRVLRVRIAGEQVEIVVGTRVRRLSLTGGRVEHGVGALDQPRLTASGREGQVTLALDGCAPAEVEALAEALEAATRATPVHQPPIPEALHALRQRTSEARVRTLQ